MDKKINDTDANALASQLKKLLSDKKLYKNPDLKISDVANQLNIPVHQLSQLLNDNIGKNFPSIINEYRILEAKEMLLQNDKYTLEAIGYECGFKSKSAFYTAFKKHVGLTPAKYIDNKKSITL
jgi:AraC-like DNA-binding protein